MAVIAGGLLAAVALSSGSGAQAATPTVSFSGLCVLGLANVITPSPSGVSVGPAGAVQVTNKASGSLKVSSNGKSVTLGKGDSTVFSYPGSDAVRSYPVKASCAAVDLSSAATVTVAANPAPAKPDPKPADDTPAPGAGSGSGTGSGSGSGSGTGAGSGTGTGSGTGGTTGGTSPVAGVPVTGVLPPGFGNVPVALSAPGAGNLPIPDVQAAVPGSPGEAAPPAVDLLASGDDAQAAAQPATRQVAQSRTSSPSIHMLLILVATVLFLGVGAAAVRAVRATRPGGAALARA
ncbi:MAG TPA: hypothetical protein VGO94_02100 [Mycobacteriales bacterium]|nr:hypothetical protein [Mycobacteriales bacterium]